MPTYVYECKGKDHPVTPIFEVHQSIHEDTLTVCPYCGSTDIRKIPSAAPTHFKGDGWTAKTH